MTTNAVLAPLTRQQFFDNNGKPLSGGLLYSYSAGTNTPAPTFTDYTGAVQNPNPLTLDARGSCSLWVTPNVALKINITDSLGNTIPGYPVDQITVAQLLSLYGGVDTGLANGYILTFASSYSGYSDGQVIYWIPSHNNTGASTINVNGFGTVNITNVDGTTLGANQIVAGQITEIIFYQTSFQLLSVAQLTGTTIGTFGAFDNIASASTTDLGSAPAHNVSVTGTATITSFGSSASLLAPIYKVDFTAGITLTHNATTLILPEGLNIVTSLGDSCLAEYAGSGHWQVLIYQSSYPHSGSFTATLTGPASPPTGTMYYRLAGTPGSNYVVTLYLASALTGTYSSGSVTITGIPAALRPSAQRSVGIIMESNGTTAIPAMATLSTGGVISFLTLNSGVYNGVVNSGVCGLTADWSMSYPI